MRAAAPGGRCGAEAGRVIPNFSWLEPGVLAGSAMPGYFGLATLEDDLRDAHEEGIRTIISLTEEGFDGTLLEQEGFRYFHIPVIDHTAPTLGQMHRFAAIVMEERDAGSPVLAHCFAGIGRTGTMLGAWLVANGVAPVEAIRRVRELRPGSIETVAQERALHHFRAYLAEQGALPDPGR